jgi:DNA-binding transcriptional ArsR family regulator
MLSLSPLSLEECVEVLKAAGEPTRLRLVALLSHGDLTVSEMTEVLGQSQPRISRHLKLLGEAGLVERYQEGAWAYFRLSRDGLRARLMGEALAAASSFRSASRTRCRAPGFGQESPRQPGGGLFLGECGELE